MFLYGIRSLGLPWIIHSLVRQGSRLAHTHVSDFPEKMKTAKGRPHSSSARWFITGCDFDIWQFVNLMFSCLTGLQPDDDSNISFTISGNTLDPSARASPGFQAQRSKVTSFLTLTPDTGPRSQREVVLCSIRETSGFAREDCFMRVRPDVFEHPEENEWLKWKQTYVPFMFPSVRPLQFRFVCAHKRFRFQTEFCVLGGRLFCNFETMIKCSSWTNFPLFEVNVCSFRWAVMCRMQTILRYLLWEIYFLTRHHSVALISLYQMLSISFSPHNLPPLIASSQGGVHTCGIVRQ